MRPSKRSSTRPSIAPISCIETWPACARVSSRSRSQCSPRRPWVRPTGELRWSWACSPCRWRRLRRISPRRSRRPPPRCAPRSRNRMALFLSFRSAPRAGGVLRDPQVLQGEGLVDPVRLRLLERVPADAIAGRELVFGAHGFNVGYEEGVHELARLERELRLPGGFAFIGVLWPGDWWIPVVNYPAEADDAVACGRNLARFVNRRLSLAAGVSFVAHSLGARLV